MIYLGRQIVKVVICLGMKYEPLSDTPPPSLVIKICEWGPWSQRLSIRRRTEGTGCLCFSFVATEVIQVSPNGFFLDLGLISSNHVTAENYKDLYKVRGYPTVLITDPMTCRLFFSNQCSKILQKFLYLFQ